MSNLAEALNRIKNWQEQNGYQAASKLLPGLNHTEIQELSKDLPIELPTEVYELYQWRNGSSDDSWYFPLQKAVAKYLRKVQYYDISWMTDLIRDPDGSNWFQIFVNGIEDEHEGYIVICENGKDYSILFLDFKGGDYLITKKYTSLTSMMMTIAECRENGISEQDREGYIIWHKYNKGVDPVKKVGLNLYGH